MMTRFRRVLTQLAGSLMTVVLVGPLLGLPTLAQATPHAVTVAHGLVNPWSVAFLPDGRFLVTERPGRLRIVAANGKVGPALAGVPPVV